MAMKSRLHFCLYLTILASAQLCPAHFLREHRIGEDYFTSVQSLTYLVSVENSLLTFLESNKDLLISIDPEFGDQLYLWMEEHTKALRDPAKYVAHPITCFQLIKRLTVEWMDLRENVINKAPSNITDTLEKDVEPFLPTVSDLNGAVHGISFLCSVYSLPFDDFMDGKIMDRQYDVALTVYDVLEMIYVSLSNGRAINAFLMTMEIIYRRDYPISLLRDTQGLFDKLEAALNSSGNPQMSADLSNLLYRKLNNIQLPGKPVRQFQNDFIRKQREIMHMTRDKKDNTRENFPDEESREAIIEDFRKFCAFCKYPNLSRSVLNKRLFCRFKRDLPYLKLAPLKVEELNLDPPVLLFHDAISDDDIQFLKDAAIPNMQRAVVVNHDKAMRTEKGQNYSDSRISETAWLDEGEDPRLDDVLARLNVRMNHMTSRRMVTSESLQINNYGLGGYFAPHYDALHYNRAYLQPNDFDNREATIMFYMSDVKQGGGTVFLDLQLSVLPQKGAALFWDNLRSDRSVNIDTLHGACPVLVGNKWVCNKWIHRFDSNPYSIPQSSVWAS